MIDFKNYLVFDYIGSEKRNIKTCIKSCYSNGNKDLIGIQMMMVEELNCNGNLHDHILYFDWHFVIKKVV